MAVVLRQIQNCFLHKGGVVLKVSESDITRMAKQPTYTPCYLVVIYAKLLYFFRIIMDSRFWILAYGALVILLKQHVFVFFKSYTVLLNIMCILSCSLSRFTGIIFCSFSETAWLTFTVKPKVTIFPFMKKLGGSRIGDLTSRTYTNCATHDLIVPQRRGSWLYQ